MIEDSRFQQLLDMVEEGVPQLDKVGLEHRKWAYSKLQLPGRYRAKANLSVRLLDKAKDLQGDLMDAVEVEAILEMVETQHEVFNKVNASTAIHRVARLATQPGAGGRSKGAAPPKLSEILADERFVRLMRMVEKGVPEMTIQGISNVLWALARLQVPVSPEFLETVAGRAAHQADRAEPKVGRCRLTSA